MKFLAALTLILGSVFTLPLSGYAQAGPKYREGELLVQFREGVSPGEQSALHAGNQGKIRRHLPDRVQLVSLPPDLGVDEAVGRYRNHPHVRHAEPNFLVQRAIVTPNDSLFSSQWHLYNTGQRYSGTLRGTAGVDIGAPEAWALHTGSDEIVVAIIDSGVDYLHPDLAANLWSNPGEVLDGRDNDGNGKVDDIRGWNFASGNNDSMDVDSDSHGTHVAGIIGAVGNNQVGVSGVNWRVRLMPLRTLGENGVGSIADAIAAIDYATLMGARVINASYGYPSGCVSASPSSFERQAIERAGAAGVLFVAAAGNSSCDTDLTPFYPAAYPLSNIVAVAATDARDNLAPFSNYGAKSVHLAAPGVQMMSTLHRDRGGYGTLSGTSMAAPVVSGAAALLFSYRPDLTMPEVRRLLLDTSFSYPAILGKVAFGRLDAGEAFAGAAPPVPELPATPENLTIFSRSADYIELAWNNTSAEGTVEVERRVGAGGFEPLVTLPAASTGYRDEGGSDREGSLFSYRIRARTAAGVSAWSPEAGIAEPPLAPQNVQGDLDQTGVLLTWEDHSQVESGYQIERRREGGTFQHLATLPGDSIDYFDGAVTPGVTYGYRVRALSSVTGPSPYTEELTITFPSPSTVTAAPAPSAESGGGPPGGGGGGGCFIATAAFGSELHPRVAVLRQFRDEKLLPHRWGRLLNDLYLKTSPPVARWIEKRETLRSVVRSALVPVLWLAERWMGGEKKEFTPAAEGETGSAAPL